MADDSMPKGSVKKFTPDGESKLYQGHSVIALLPENSPLRDTLKQIRQALENHELAETAFPNDALLPEDSWHMTVFICVRDLERNQQVMPRPGYADNIKKVSGLEGPYDEWLEYTISTLQGLELDDTLKPPYELTVKRQIPEIKHTIGLALEPHSSSLLGLRERLSEATGIELRSPDAFQFHLTIAYMTRHLNEEEKDALKGLVEDILQYGPDTVQFGKVELCSFQDMQAFEPEVTVAQADY
ncbi:RNA ligase/cyclic nucleotide phosphodiesterase [Aspergillus karnatakaensis]|uniref:RNA ligase/cyclic nucleotide phosphodiesterase n=1 Tax=Aspergillus karnatakaensis TaxID=1810916 RepID=UPI003CCCB5D5